MDDSPKKNTRRRRVSTVLIALGVIAIAAALALLCYNAYDDNRAESEAGAALDDLLGQLPDASADELARQAALAGGGDMPVTYVDGVAYIGYLELCDLGINLPVAAEYRLSQLRSTPARYSGSVYTDDIVICAHNCSTHFGGLRDLDAGSKVYFVDATGLMWEYEVLGVEVVQPTAISEMLGTDGSGSSWDMTLFTCTPGGAARVAVRLKRC